jgi:hypothetical protein
MPNTNNPTGFTPQMRTQGGGMGTGIGAHKLATYATALFIGDAITKAAGGTKPTACIDSNITPGTTPVLGVVMNWGAASVATDHNVILASGNAVFEVQGDGTGAVFLVAASLAKNANIAKNAPTAANLALKKSGHALSETSLAVTNTLDLKVRKLWESPDNLLGQYARVEITFNNLVDADQKAGI